MKSLVEDLGFTYFETVEIPVTHVSNPSGFIVAIALKHSIISIKPATAPDFTTKELLVEKGFKFSRMPIKTKIAVRRIQYD